MNHPFAACLLAALATSAHAAEPGPYLGMTLARSGSIDATARNGAVVESEHTGFSGRLYGGYRINHVLALEGGYRSHGTYTLANTGAGVAGDASMEFASLYAAVKGSYAVNQHVDLFGKLNLVHTRVEVAGLNSGDVSLNRLLLGAGVEYHATPRLGLTLELTRYGSVTLPHTGRLNLNRLEAGVNWRF